MPPGATLVFPEDPVPAEPLSDPVEAALLEAAGAEVDCCGNGEWL